jgi:hypothetical protein
MQEEDQREINEQETSGTTRIHGVICKGSRIDFERLMDRLERDFSLWPVYRRSAELGVRLVIKEVPPAIVEG